MNTKGVTVVKILKALFAGLIVGIYGIFIAFFIGLHYSQSNLGPLAIGGFVMIGFVVGLIAGFIGYI